MLLNLGKKKLALQGASNRGTKVRQRALYLHMPAKGVADAVTLDVVWRFWCFVRRGPFLRHFFREISFSSIHAIKTGSPLSRVLVRSEVLMGVTSEWLKYGMELQYCRSMESTAVM